MQPLTNRIELTQADRIFFSENGFIKLKNFLTQESLEPLRELTSKNTNSPPEVYSGDFSKIGYDVEETITYDIFSSNNFKYVVKQLTGGEFTFLQGIGFNLAPNQTGFNWHHDLLSLCYVRPEDMAYTLWIPLDPIKTNEQHGGLAYVSRKVHSAWEYFRLVYQLIQQKDIFEFAKTEEFKEFDFQYASKVEEFLLEKNKIEDDFDLGDALLLDKFVWHKSCPLKEGILPSRMAYVMRLADSQARFSKLLLKGVYSLLQATGNDLQSDLGYRLDSILKEGQAISAAGKL